MLPFLTNWPSNFTRPGRSPGLAGPLRLCWTLDIVEPTTRATIYRSPPGPPGPKSQKKSFLGPSNPCFFWFPIFLAFLYIFLPFARIFFGGSAKRRTLAFLGKNPRFLQKSKGWRVRVLGVSETGSAIDVRIDDAGSILKFRIGFSPWFSAVVSHLRLRLLVGLAGIEAVDTEFPHRVPIVDRGTIAVPLFADPISDS